MTQPPQGKTSRTPLLGDVVTAALSTVGLTEERVSGWLGGPCGCSARREKLNALHLWAKRVMTGKREKAVEYLEEIIHEENGRPPPSPP